MKINRPVYLSLFISICSYLAHITAAGHYCLIRFGLVRRPPFLAIISGYKYNTLHRIYHMKIARRLVSVLVRSPLRSSTLKMVKCIIPVTEESGSIILTCHTPWKRLLIQWCMEKKFALIVSNGEWTSKRGGDLERSGKGFRDLRSIVRHLQQKGRIIMSGDNFNELDNCPVRFLGKDRNVSLLPTRIAKVAKVPLIPTIPVFSHGEVILEQVHQKEDKNRKPDSVNSIKQFLEELEKQLRMNPFISNFY